MGDRFQGEATRSVRQWGMNSYKFPDMKFDRYGHARFQEEPGRLDMIAWRSSRMAHIEVKDGYSSFAFSNFEANKREYVKNYCTPRFAEAWLWLCLGQGQPQWKSDKMPRRTWLVPISYWYSVEDKIRPYQLSIPYQVGKGYGLEMQKNSLDAVTLLKDFELQWVKGIWSIPQTHAFYKLYLKPEPIPLYRQEENKSEQRSSAIATPNPKRYYGSRRYLDYRIRGNDAGYGLARESLLYPRSDASIGNFERQDHTSHALLRLAGAI